MLPLPYLCLLLLDGLNHFSETAAIGGHKHCCLSGLVEAFWFLAIRLF
jgi:hypothetical protein